MLDNMLELLGMDSAVLVYTLRAVLWAFSPALVLGGAWLMVAIVQRWLAVRRVNRYARTRLDKAVRAKV